MYSVLFFPHGGKICNHYLHFAVEFPLAAVKKKKKSALYSIYQFTSQITQSESTWLDL